MKTKKDKACKCHTEINELLKERKAQLVGTIRLDGSAPKALVATESNGETMRHKFMPVMLVANYCPFCGKVYPETKKPAPKTRASRSKTERSARG